MFITLFSSIRESLRRGVVISRLALALFGAAAVAQAKPVAFDIPAQSAADALIAFSKQSKADVLYSFKDLTAARSRAVLGDFEPAAAIAMLLKDTGFAATLDEGKFVVVREKLKPGSIGGSLVEANTGAAANGVMVTLRETGATAVTGRTGGYFFNEVPAGAYTLLAAAEGFARLKITDVVVKAGTETTLSVQSMPVIKRDGAAQVMEEFVVSAKGTELMDKFEVSDLRAKPFSGANMDITRTINDTQPYTIFDAKTLEQSGATNVEDFLKQRLTMNTVALTNGQTATTTGGNTSTINLRGVGTDKTLILVNGRRVAGVTILNNSNQPDLNGIPLNSIERIEVLPSSASGIYGGSAIGGVVNVILKRDYAGGELRAGYDNTWNTDAPRRTLSASYGLALEGGKTHVMINGSWSDSRPLLLQDRVDIYRANFVRIQQTLPTFVFSSGAIYLGAVPNIQATGAANLILINGNTPINSRISFVPAGTSPSTSGSKLAAGLLANAGQWNLDLPATTQASTGLLRPLGNSPTNKSFQASVRRQMLPKLEVFADFTYNRNQTASIFNGLNNVVDVAAPTVANPNSVNPFTTRVQVRVPDASQIPITTVSENRNATLGATTQLPFGWTGEFDYTWSENRFNYRQVSLDNTAFGNDANSGAINPFVDTLLYPLNFQKYYVTGTYRGLTQLQDFALRGSGPLPALPWGTPTLTAGLEHRLAHTPERSAATVNPITITNDAFTTYYARDAQTDSGYMEATVPLIKTGWLPALHALELQAAGRSERYEVDSGSATKQVFPNRTPVVINYGTPTLNGLPVFSKDTYTSNNFTAGLKYQPVKELTLRASRATAFLPPTPAQLIKDPLPGTFAQPVNDPVTGTRPSVVTIGGGNPDLKPQNSKSLNVGVIWEPT